MRLYYWIKENRTKWYTVNGVLSVLVLIFVKSPFWEGFATGLLMVASVYFLGVLFKAIKYKLSDK